MTRKARLLAGVGASIGVLVLVVYVILIMNEDDDTVLEVAPWAVTMATASTAAAVGAATARRRLVFLAGVVFIVVGIPAVFSVGLPLIVAGVVCLAGSSRAFGRGESALTARSGPNSAGGNRKGRRGHLNGSAG